MAVEKGFDFLGLHFEPGKVLPGKATLQRFKEKLDRLYEQDLGA